MSATGAADPGAAGAPPGRAIPGGVRRRALYPLVVLGPLAAAIVFPLVENGNQGTMSIAVFALIFMAAVSAWNIFSGYSGYLALGHAVFFGIGAYTISLIGTDWHVPAGWAVMALVPVCGVTAGLVAIPVGMAGGLWAYFLGSVYPQSAFDPLFDIALALMGFFGGIGTIAGPLVGALVLESLQQYFTQKFSANGLYLIVYGALFLAVIMLMPRGIVPSAAQWLRSWRTHRAEGASTPPASAGIAEATR